MRYDGFDSNINEHSVNVPYIVTFINGTSFFNKTTDSSSYSSGYTLQFRLKQRCYFLYTESTLR